MKPKYTIVIQWSEEDDCYVVSLPEWGEFCHTHGDSYEEALHNAQEVLVVCQGCFEGLKTLKTPLKWFL